MTPERGLPGELPAFPSTRRERVPGSARSTGAPTRRAGGARSPTGRATAPPRVAGAPGARVLTPAQRSAARRRRQAQFRRRRVVAAALVGTVVTLIAFSLSGGGGGGSVRPRPARAATVPSPHLTAALPAAVAVPGRPPTFAWPAKGQGAVGVAGVGLVARSPAERSVPIASLTKMMTAYLVLHDHPLAPGSQGPTLVMTRADVADWVHASQNDLSNIQVRAGERLTEYQLLEALLLPSADNIADRLAIWDAGSIAAFVHKMNVTATALGLSATHYADASGVNPGSRSDAADQALLAGRLMANPVVRSIVSRHSVAFPVAGTIDAINPALGVDGIIGVKSGYTSQALGCLATAAWRGVGGTRALVVTVALGQVDGLWGAARVDEQLLTTATGALVPVKVAAAGERVASVRVDWSKRHVGALAATGVTVPGWPGFVMRRTLVPVSGATLARNLQGAHRTGAPEVGTLVVSSPFGVVRRVAVVAASALARPPGTNARGA